MLKKIRLEKKLTQQEAASFLGISLRSYKSYENDEDKRNRFLLSIWFICKGEGCWNKSVIDLGTGNPYRNAVIKLAEIFKK